MITFARRRMVALATTSVAMVLAVGLLDRTHSLDRSARLSGWVLFTVMVFLAIYNLRKKLTYPPLLRSSTWLQLHVYVGFLSVLLFLLHVAFRWPSGPLEVTLAILYVLVAGSGVIGLFLSRTIPSRLAVRGGEVLFERIPAFRKQLRERAEELILESTEESKAMTLANFYRARLLTFFAGSRNFSHHVIQSAVPLHRLVHELRDLDRYLSDAERKTSEELVELIETKDGLDYHQAMQSLLKGWLFFHIPLTYALLLLAVVHVVLVYAFSGVTS